MDRKQERRNEEVKVKKMRNSLKRKLRERRMGKEAK